jgi:hypothetical protein
MINKFLIALAFFISFNACATDTPNGIDRGNGGDEYSQEFVNIGYELVESLMKEPLAGVDPDSLMQAIKATKVKSTSAPLILRGQEVSAINDPFSNPPQIVINSQAWENMNSSSHKKVFLVFHEYLGIMGIDDANYQVSSLLDRAQVCDRNEVIKNDIEEELQKSCYRIIPDDLRYVDSISSYGKKIDRITKKDLMGLNLKNIRLAENTFLDFDLNLLHSQNRLSFLDLGSSVSDLSNCSFLENKTNLRNLWLSDSGYSRNYRTYRPLSNIASGCFANLELNELYVSLDGKSSQYRGFLQGMKTIKNLHIDGKNIDSIPLEEFKGLSPRYLNFTAYDHSISLEFVKGIEKITSLKCSPGQVYENYHPNSIEFNCQQKARQ